MQKHGPVVAWIIFGLGRIPETGVPHITNDADDGEAGRAKVRRRAQVFWDGGFGRARINELPPGMVETEGLHAVGFAVDDFRKMVESQTPLSRIAQPQDIARAAVLRIRRCRLGCWPGRILAGGKRK